MKLEIYGIEEIRQRKARNQLTSFFPETGIICKMISGKMNVN